MKKITILLIVFFITQLSAQDYSFDFEEFEKRSYEYVGTFQIQSEFLKLNDSSELYKLSFLNKENKDYLDSHSASLQLRGSYEISKFKYSLNIKDQLTFSINDEWENNFSIYESFINANLSTNFDLQIGKKSVKWGKGYIWNPVSMVGRQKDINDVDAGLEGFWMLKLDYVKSLSGILQNFAISPVIIAVNRNLNEDFSDEEEINFVLNNYILIKDTDIDFYLLLQNCKFKKFGADFARNILPNWEIHAEYLLEKNVMKSWWNSSFKIETSIADIHNYIFGSRVLFLTNTTLIMEYLHNDSGLNEEQMNNFFTTIELATSGNPILLPAIKQYQIEDFSNQFLMKDYLYLKLSQPELFDILYFTPSVFILYNINDNSRMIGGDFNYSRFDNLNLKVKYSLLIGRDNSEFGEKNNFGKLAFQLDYSF
ncbi:MAG: hypothetical protein KAS49_08810 [Candidatus Cloacimonetes bacterium]|nr:hypothetical protein [Candidatus Cloacimonadota bacterium]